MILWKYQQKKHKKCKGSLSAWRITCSFVRFSSSCYVVQEENVLQYLTEKIIIMEKFMLPREMLKIIVFCKAQHNA